MIVTNLSTIKETYPKIWQYVHTALTAYEKNPGASGRQEIDGEMVFFTLSEDPLQPQEERRLEVHRRYADVQIVLKGSERYGYTAGIFNGNFAENTLEQNDLAFAAVDEPCQYTDLKENDAVIFLPGHAHKPLCIPADGNRLVKKAIIKIDSRLFPDLFS